jgi:5'-3' exoribonuclease 1
MGIKDFYNWFKETFPTAIESHAPSSSINNLYIDANCLIHDSAQIVYGCSDRSRLLSKSRNRKLDRQSSINKVCERFVETIENIVLITMPTNKVIVAIDGVAPAAKQRQQLQRRVESLAKRELTECTFDSNQITAGTEFMNSFVSGIKPLLGKLAIKIDCELVFSGHEEPGEGEHKLMHELRSSDRVSSDRLVHCIVGNDADLIMMGLINVDSLIYIMRSDHEYVNLQRTRFLIETNLLTPIDFVVIFFLLGNDFLPKLSCLEIKSGAVSLLCDSYYKCQTQGKLVTDGVNVNFVKLSELCQILNDRVCHSSTDDPSLNTAIGRDYLVGVQWVLNYYTRGFVGPGNANWSWSFPHNRSPTLDEILYNGCYETVQFISDDPPDVSCRLLEILPKVDFFQKD